MKMTKYRRLLYDEQVIRGLHKDERGVMCKRLLGWNATLLLLTLRDP